MKNKQKRSKPIKAFEFSVLSRLCTFLRFCWDPNVCVPKSSAPVNFVSLHTAGTQMLPANILHL